MPNGFSSADEPDGAAVIDDTNDSADSAGFDDADQLDESEQWERRGTTQNPSLQAGANSTDPNGTADNPITFGDSSDDYI